MKRMRLALLGFILTVAPVKAQDELDKIEPDRPDVTNSAKTVGVGIVQVELGGIYTRDRPGQHTIGSPVTVRIGMARWLEGRVETSGLLSQAEGGDRATGFGDVSVGAKIRLWRERGSVPPLSIQPAVNLPTASVEKGLGSGDADYVLTLLTGADLGPHAHIDVNYRIGAIGAGGGGPHFLQHLASASTSVEATENLAPYVELYWVSKADPDTRDVTAINTGVIYWLTATLAVDGGMQFGTSRAAPGFAAFAGLSFGLGGSKHSTGAALPTSVFRPAPNRD